MSAKKDTRTKPKHVEPTQVQSALKLGNLGTAKPFLLFVQGVCGVARAFLIGSWGTRGALAICCVLLCRAVFRSRVCIVKMCYMFLMGECLCQHPSPAVRRVLSAGGFVSSVKRIFDCHIFSSHGSDGGPPGPNRQVQPIFQGKARALSGRIGGYRARCQGPALQ